MTTSTHNTEQEREYSQIQIIKDKSFNQFLHSLTDASSVSEVLDKLLKLVHELYDNDDCTFYHLDKSTNSIISSKRRNEQLERVAILDDKLISRIKSIKKPVLRKRSISKRKNIQTVYYPFVFHGNLEFLLEIPLNDQPSDSKKIIGELKEILPIVYISLQKVDNQKQKDNESTETTKIIQSISSGIASIDSKGIFLFANQMFEMMTGYTLGELRNSSTLINNIFPDLTFILLEGDTVEGVIYNIRRKDGSVFPSHVKLTQVTKGDETTLILTINDATYHIKQEEEIKNLRRSMSNEDNIGVALFRFASFGGELVKEDLRSITIAPEYFSTMCYTSIAQGNTQPIGVFGPIPAPKLENYRTIIYAFFGKDDIPLDYRMKGKQYYLIAVILPNRKTEFLISNMSIEKRFCELISGFEYPNRMTKEDLSQFREVVFVE
ncbi:MAG: PAS domain S-box protein [Candidatus Heimdallarchaeaceae archaeon]